MRRLNIQVTENHKMLLSKHKKEGQSVSGFIRHILDDYFDAIKKKSNKKNETSI